MPKRKRPTIANFKHCRLHSPRSIRLLTLQPSSDVSSPLEISLLEVSLDDSPSNRHSYEALSYVWGASVGSVPCTCDSKILLITPNCDDALRHLRLPDQNRTLWVDAICIDQGNDKESLKERGIQITLMGEVYRSAERTLCWLGSGEEYTAGTFEYLRRIGSCPSKRELRKLLNYDEQLRQKGKLEEDSTCLNHVFCHSWHSRVWTLQEVGFSRDCQIICGYETISWDLYLKAARFLIFDESIDEVDARAWKNYVSIGIRNDIRTSLSTSSAGQNDRTIEFLTSALTQVRHLQSTDPKDRIYGLYAVFSALDIPLPSPDYGKPLEKIYEEACVAVILHSRTLQMLDYACSNARSKNLASWVPDWQDEDVILFIPRAYATDGSRISQSQISALSPTTGQLHVRGRAVGSIVARAENDFATLEFPSGSLPILKEDRYDFVGNEVDSLRMLVHRIRLFREWMGMVDAILPLYPEDDSSNYFHQLLRFKSDPSDARLFNAFVDILQYPNSLYDLSDGEIVAKAWKDADKTRARYWTTELSRCSIIAAALLTKSARRSGQAAPEVAELWDFIAQILGDMGNRVLILLHDTVLNAKVPGTAFHMTTVGDSIVLLEGAEHPVVLRQKGDKWLFVGPAYVVGIMDGEAWPDDDNGLQDLQDFVLL